VPFLRGDFGVFAHAHAGGTIADRRNVETHIAQPEIDGMGELLSERTRGLKLPYPVRQRHAETKLNLAEAIDAAHQRKIAHFTVDHPGGFEYTIMLVEHAITVE
jgi:hypothetical protein